MEITNLQQPEEEGIIWYPNQTTICQIFFRNIFSHSNGNKKHPKKSFINKPGFLGLLVLEIGKINMYE